MRKINFETLEEQKVFFDDLFTTNAFISQRHRHCMKGAYWNGKEVRKRYFIPGDGISIDIMDYTGVGISWSRVDEKNFGKSIFIFKYLPLDLFDAIEAAINNKEMIYFDVESGKAYKCTAEFQQANYGIYFNVKFQNGETVLFSKQDYGKKFVFLDLESDRRLFPR